MKTRLVIAALGLAVALGLAGCPKDGTDAAPATDTGPGTDAAPACSMTGNTCDDWCTAYLANCAADNNFPAGYDTTMCMADCPAAQTDIDCRAYHACFAGTFAAGSTDRDDHCDHSIAVAICN